MNVESPEKVASRIRRALPFVPPEHIIVSTDCGMKYLPAMSLTARCERWWKESRLSGVKWKSRSGA